MTTETILTLEQIHHLWDTRVIEPTEAYPLVASDKIVFARAIEQAVLQSPEIQALREDAERYRFCRSQTSPAEIHIYGVELGLADDELDAAVDEEMKEWRS